MQRLYYCEQEFANIDFTQELADAREYEQCVFKSCNFEGATLNQWQFTDCEFEDCNLSNVSSNQLCLLQVNFTRCKLLGIDFSVCKPFGFSIKAKDSSLMHSNFSGMDLQKCAFEKCDLSGVDFIESQLKGVALSQCNFLNSQFDYSDLRQCDFRHSQNLQLSLTQNQVKGAKFSLDAAHALLAPFGIELDQN